MREDNSCKHGFAFGLHNFSVTSDRAVSGQQELIYENSRIICGHFRSSS